MSALSAASADSVLQHTDALAVGTRLAEFELQTLLGVGGFGMVYRAYDHSLHRLVAIKEYMPAALAGRVGAAVSVRSSAGHAPFQAGLKSFMAEARMLAQFDHPSLVKVFRVWEQNHTAYIAMPLYQGMTLQQAYAHMRSPPPDAWLRTMLWSLLEALTVLHAHHLVHRDLSPDNIFLQDMGPPVLLDLGAARRAIGEHTQRHTAILKVNYAPIEQYADAEDLRQGPWSDLYALAAVVHGCLNRAPPMPATFRVLRDRLPPVASVVESLHAQFGLVYSPSLVDALTQALAVQPADRPQSTAAFVDRLQLVAPPALDRFDWRAEMGDGWQPAALHPQAAANAVPLEVPAGARARNDAERPPEWAALAPEPATLRVPQPSAGARRGRGPVFWRLASALAGCVLLAMLLIIAPTSGPAKRAGGTATDAPTPPVAMADASAEGGAAPGAATTGRAEGRRDGAKVGTRPSARAMSAEDICPDSNFLTRPMCLHRACQTARYAGMPVCVENNRRLGGSRPNGA